MSQIISLQTGFDADPFNLPDPGVRPFQLCDGNGTIPLGTVLIAQ